MAINEIGWDTLAPNSSSSWFIHGYTAYEAVTFSIVVSGNVNPGHATLTQGESIEHVDRTKAYKIYIQNNAPTSTTYVRILENKQHL